MKPVMQILIEREIHKSIIDTMYRLIGNSEFNATEEQIKMMRDEINMRKKEEQKLSKKTQLYL